MPVAAAILRLSFIAAVKGELKPSHADNPLFASRTMVYLAITSAIMMLVRIVRLGTKLV